ncbi:hypothetical protein VKT23_011098 [Stygiomarasmius scandens]|uniref:Uncharacterized protein n=1 Tax=Marasmiellus scandens TaxID=2682957 RepID=A0ABR1JD98_9AGAR
MSHDTNVYARPQWLVNLRQSTTAQYPTTTPWPSHLRYNEFLDLDNQQLRNHRGSAHSTATSLEQPATFVQDLRSRYLPSNPCPPVPTYPLTDLPRSVSHDGHVSISHNQYNYNGCDYATSQYPSYPTQSACSYPPFQAGHLNTGNFDGSTPRSAQSNDLLIANQVGHSGLPFFPASPTSSQLSSLNQGIDGSISSYVISGPLHVRNTLDSGHHQGGATRYDSQSPSYPTQSTLSYLSSQAGLQPTTSDFNEFISHSMQPSSHYNRGIATPETSQSNILGSQYPQFLGYLIPSCPSQRYLVPYQNVNDISTPFQQLPAQNTRNSTNPTPTALAFSGSQSEHQPQISNDFDTYTPHIAGPSRPSYSAADIPSQSRRFDFIQTHGPQPQPDPQSSLAQNHANHNHDHFPEQLNHSAQPNQITDTTSGAELSVATPVEPRGPPVMLVFPQDPEVILLCYNYPSSVSEVRFPPEHVINRYKLT